MEKEGFLESRVPCVVAPLPPIQIKASSQPASATYLKYEIVWIVQGQGETKKFPAPFWPTASESSTPCLQGGPGQLVQRPGWRRWGYSFPVQRHERLDEGVNQDQQFRGPPGFDLLPVVRGGALKKGDLVVVGGALNLERADVAAINLDDDGRRRPP